MSSSSSQAQTPPFLNKLYQLVSDPTTKELVSWTDEKGLAFTVHKPSEFGRDVLPKYFKHNNFSSFVRQLNQYGFHKQNPDNWTFGHDNFRRDRPELLQNITRRRPKPQASASAQGSAGNALSQKAVVELGNYGIEGEVKALKRDKDLLLKELFITRQAEEKLKNKCDNLEHRMETLEKSSMRMQAFIMHYFSQVLQPYSTAMASRKRKRITSSSSKDMMDTGADDHTANQPIAQPIAHPPPSASSMDALRVMMQQMQMNMARQSSQQPLPSPAPNPSSALISPQQDSNAGAFAFAPATVQELPMEDLPVGNPPLANGKHFAPSLAQRRTEVVQPIKPAVATNTLQTTNSNTSSVAQKPASQMPQNSYEVIELLGGMPSTPDSSYTMDAIETALKDTAKPNGTHLDTPDMDLDNFVLDHDENMKSNENCDPSKAIEEFLEFDSEETPLPPPLTHLPEGTDMHALALQIEGMVDMDGEKK